MKIKFFKYQATGNDFVIIDNRTGNYTLTIEQIMRLCDRKFGVGCDGVMIIENDPEFDFKLSYYNGDGTQSLCGNGSRAAVKIASDLGVIEGKTTFNAYDGPHEAEVLGNDIIKLKMNDVNELKNVDGGVSVNTGSPHFVKFVATLNDYPVTPEGRAIRYSKTFHPIGTNANFVEEMGNNTLFVRTYERGVEEETLSCGTGVTASALAASLKGYTSPVKIKVLGGELSIEFKSKGNAFSDIYLIGPARKVFEGEIEI
jgi:diaminopimelate epimerase